MFPRLLSAVLDAPASSRTCHDIFSAWRRTDRVDNLNGIDESEPSGNVKGSPSHIVLRLEVCAESDENLQKRRRLDEALPLFETHRHHFQDLPLYCDEQWCPPFVVAGIDVGPLFQQKLLERYLVTRSLCASRRTFAISTLSYTTAERSGVRPFSSRASIFAPSCSRTYQSPDDSQRVHPPKEPHFHHSDIRKHCCVMQRCLASLVSRFNICPAVNQNLHKRLSSRAFAHTLQFTFAFSVRFPSTAR